MSGFPAESGPSNVCAFMSTRPSVMGPLMSSVPNRHAAGLTLLSVVDAKGRHTMLLEGAMSLSSFAWFVG